MALADGFVGVDDGLVETARGLCLEIVGDHRVGGFRALTAVHRQHIYRSTIRRKRDASGIKGSHKFRGKCDGHRLCLARGEYHPVEAPVTAHSVPKKPDGIATGLPSQVPGTAGADQQLALFTRFDVPDDDGGLNRIFDHVSSSFCLPEWKHVDPSSGRSSGTDRPPLFGGRGRFQEASRGYGT